MQDQAIQSIIDETVAQIDQIMADPAKYVTISRISILHKEWLQKANSMNVFN